MTPPSPVLPESYASPLTSPTPRYGCSLPSLDPTPAEPAFGFRHPRGQLNRPSRWTAGLRPVSGFTVLLHFLSANSAAGRLDGHTLPRWRANASPFRPGILGRFTLPRAHGC